MTSDKLTFSFIEELSAIFFVLLESLLEEIPSLRPILPAGRRELPTLSPVGLTSLMLGVSLGLMLGGSLTFLIGFMMIPWVLGMVMFVYFVELVCGFSVLRKVVLRLVSFLTLTKDLP